jgi:hypothetical protein
MIRVPFVRLWRSASDASARVILGGAAGVFKWQEKDLI